MSKFLLCRAVTLLVGFILVANYPQSVWATEQPVGQPVVTKLIQAIEDEIYAKGYQTRYGDLGEPGSHGVHRIAVYVQPLISKGRGWIVYKLMPFGEIYRMYSISADGEVRLHGDPSIGFPPTQPDYLTLYMDDEDLCKIKGSWQKEYFSIQLHPAASRVTEAKARKRQQQ